MNPIAPLFANARLFFVVFGVVMAAGGLMGYVNARSVASLVAGGVSGALLVLGALLLPRSATWTAGAVLNLLVSLALLGRFAPLLLRGSFNPAGYVAPLALIGAVWAGLLLFSHGHP